MTDREVFSNLVAWTPYLLEGFAWNLWIAGVAAIIGTGIGALLAGLRGSSTRSLAATGDSLSGLINRIPTFALMFYCAVLLPQDFELPLSDQLVHFPNWLKAAIALAASPAGFTANNLGPAMARWRCTEHSAALLFIPSWGMNILITLIASSAASLVGVNEVLSRANKLIAATQNTELMMPIYLYVGLFFSLACALVTASMHLLRRRLLADSGPPSKPPT